MIEVPRAALRANRIALNCDFFSFGTNDLTQMTYGYSRDDMGTFLPVYIAEGILPEDPVREPRPVRRRRARRDRHAPRPRGQAEAEGRRLRRARRRSALDRVLQPRRPRLRLLLAVPRSGRAPRRGAGLARREERRHLVDGMSMHAGGARLTSARRWRRAPAGAAGRPRSSSPRRSGRAIRRAPRREALAVKDGRIVAVGTNAEDREARRAPKTVVIDGKWRRVVPGFIDCHTHMSMGGFDLLALDLRKTKDPARLHAAGRGVREDAARRASG